MTIDVKITDNSDIIRDALQDQIETALVAIGLAAESHAKELCPVDTGRLRNSITHTNDDDSAYIGTNVEYAAYVELGTFRMKARPYLKPAAENYVDEYRALAKAALKG